MPEPEILRRCQVCGAASRPGALFCPQCGNASAGTARGIEPAEESPTAQAEPAAAATPQTRPLGSRLGRVPPTGGKLRKASNAVRDTVTYDPTIRFLLVAAFVFVAFVVILLLSKFIT